MASAGLHTTARAAAASSVTCVELLMADPRIKVHPDCYHHLSPFTAKRVSNMNQAMTRLKVEWLQRGRPSTTL